MEFCFPLPHPNRSRLLLCHHPPSLVPLNPLAKHLARSFPVSDRPVLTRKDALRAGKVRAGFKLERPRCVGIHFARGPIGLKACPRLSLTQRNIGLWGFISRLAF